MYMSICYRRYDKTSSKTYLVTKCNIRFENIKFFLTYTSHMNNTFIQPNVIIVDIFDMEMFYMSNEDLAYWYIWLLIIENGLYHSVDNWHTKLIIWSKYNALRHSSDEYISYLKVFFIFLFITLILITRKWKYLLHIKYCL